MSSLSPYIVAADPVIPMLVAEAQGDAEVLGLVLLGSRSLGLINPESDYDVAFVVKDDAAQRYSTQGQPARGHTVYPPIDTTDLFTVALGQLRREQVADWMLPAWADARILYDRDGRTTAALDAMRSMSVTEAERQVAQWYDTYLNALYRSLKAWRQGNMLGGRLEAVESIAPLLHTLYALERRWRPYSSRLSVHLSALACQGWDVDELRSLLVALAATGDPCLQQQVARQVVALLHARGFDYVVQEWHGQIEHALAWTFT